MGHAIAVLRPEGPLGRSGRHEHSQHDVAALAPLAEPANRCLVPFTSFFEYETAPDGKKQPVWFALAEDRPLAFVAGIWTPWTSTRKKAEGEVTVDAYGFLTTDANAEVGAIHTKAMPVILTDPAQCDLWLDAEWSEARVLQRPLPDGALTIVARGREAGRLIVWFRPAPIA